MYLQELRGQALLTAVTALTCLGFMLVGYDNGLMSGVVESEAFDLTFDDPSYSATGIIVAIYEVGSFCGSIFAAVLGERLSRRGTIACGCWVMVVGAIVQATSMGRAQLIAGRVMSGVGQGIVNSTVPVLQSEFSPKSSRGTYVCAQLSSLNFGIFIVYWMCYGFTSSTSSYAWRIPTVLQLVPIFAMVVILFIIPESPRWLASRGRNDECLEVLARLQPAKAVDTEEVQRLHSSIVNAVALEASIGTGSWMELRKNDCTQSRTRFLIACGIQALQQLSGINPMIYYSQTLFVDNLEFDEKTALIISGALHTWFFLASFIPWFLIDRVGRRPLFLFATVAMAATMAVQAGLTYRLETSVDHSASIGAAAMLFIFEGAYTIGFQASVWAYPCEILPLRYRQKGSSLSTAVNRICNYTMLLCTPIALEKIGWKTFIVFAMINATGVPLIYFFFPETKGLELEEVDRLFAKGARLSVSSSQSVGKDSTATSHVDYSLEDSEAPKESRMMV